MDEVRKIWCKEVKPVLTETGHTNCTHLAAMATMTAMPRSLQASSLAGCVTTAVAYEVSTSLRCAWKAGGALKTKQSGVSVSVPVRRIAAPRSSIGPSGGGGGERQNFGFLVKLIIVFFRIFKVLVKIVRDYALWMLIIAESQYTLSRIIV